MNWFLSSWRVSTCGHQRAFNVLACSLRSTAHGDAAFGCRFAVLIGDIRRHSPRSCRGSPPVPRFASCGQADVCDPLLSLLRLHPSAPERTIQFHDRGELLALQRREIEFAPKQVSLGIEHLQITVESSLIAIR